MQLLQVWLVVEQFQVRWTAGLEQINNPFGLGRKMGQLCGSRGFSLIVARHQSGYRSRAHGGCRMIQKGPAMHLLLKFIQVIDGRNSSFNAAQTLANHISPARR